VRIQFMPRCCVAQPCQFDVPFLAMHDVASALVCPDDE